MLQLFSTDIYTSFNLLLTKIYFETIEEGTHKMSSHLTSQIKFLYVYLKQPQRTSITDSVIL